MTPEQIIRHAIDNEGADLAELIKNALDDAGYVIVEKQPIPKPQRQTQEADQPVKD